MKIEEQVRAMAYALKDLERLRERMEAIAAEFERLLRLDPKRD